MTKIGMLREKSNTAFFFFTTMHAQLQPKLKKEAKFKNRQEL